MVLAFCGYRLDFVVYIGLLTVSCLAEESGECRSIPNQIAFWAMIGKCALDNPDLPIEFIKDLLR